MANVTLAVLEDFATKFAGKCKGYFVKKSDIPENAKFTDTVYTHPSTAGNRHIPAGGKTGQILRWSADGTAVWGEDDDTEYSTMKGASASAAGAGGLVPAPAKGKQNAYLRGDGTWQEIEEATTEDIDAIIAGTFEETGENGEE